MRRLLIFVLLVSSLTCNTASAGEERTVDTANPLFWPSFNVGFSYPLVFSMSLGAVLPFSKQDKDYFVPSSPGLRIDGEIGLGGGSAAVGLYLPVGGSGLALNLKAVRMRTWLLTWNEATNRTFDGGVVEFVAPSPHGGPKIGIGFFRDTEPLNGRRGSFTYIYVGAGM